MKDIVKETEDELIFPGFIDLHVHARQDQSGEWNHKETFETASQAALNGGVTCFLDQPNTPKPAIDEESLKQKKELIKNMPIPLFFYAGIGPKTRPFNHEHYKAFMTKSVGEMFFTDYESLDKALALYKGKQVSFHCEDPKIIAEHPERPATAEIRAIKKAIELAKKHSLKANICHVSTKEGMQLIENAKKGITITCEATPHHLFFDNENVHSYENSDLIKMNPPIRNKEDRLYLLESLKKGKIDFLATDHAPHTLKEKKEGMSGVPNLDTYGNIVCWLMEQGVSKETITSICSTNPARFLGIKNDSLTIISKEPEKITREKLKTKCGWSPFEGITFPGKAKATISSVSCQYS